jgi:SAM-dependent methyltransferase
MRLLNLGCGARFHADWTNIDVTSSSPLVQAHDLRLGIPHPDGTFDVVYHSHVLEHFPKNAATGFLQECHRVLKPGGILRIAVPDLEQIASRYLQTLEGAIRDSDQGGPDYEWMMLELYDQVVRERSGGDMLEYLKQRPIPNEAFVAERIGGEWRRIAESLRQAVPAREDSRRRDLLRSIRRLPSRIRSSIVRRVLGKDDWRALQIGRFRLCGEVHQWMYDRYSLARLLKQCGFESVTRRESTTSAIEGWSRFNLDTDPDGSVYKPDSLYMEASKAGPA